MAKWKIWILSILFLLIDAATFLLLTLALMAYEDFYNESKGEYWSWESYSLQDKIVVVSLQAWWAVHIAAVGYMVYRLIRTWLKRRKPAIKL